MPLYPKKRKKKAKKKARPAAATVADVMNDDEEEQDEVDTQDVMADVREIMAGLIMANCSAGRSAHNARLWDSARSLRYSPSLYELLEKFFLLGREHGMDVAMRQLVLADKDRNSYAMFCKRCGKRWMEHDNVGICPDHPRAAAGSKDELTR